MDGWIDVSNLDQSIHRYIVFHKFLVFYCDGWCILLNQHLQTVSAVRNSLRRKRKQERKKNMMKAAWFLRIWPVGKHVPRCSLRSYYHPLQRRYPWGTTDDSKVKNIQWVTLARDFRCQHADEQRGKGKKRFSTALMQTLTAARRSS